MLQTRLPTQWVPLLIFLAFASLCRAVIKYPPIMVKQPPVNEELLYQVVTQPQESDKPFIIECEAQGEPAVGYRWMKNGKEFIWQDYKDRMTQQPGRGTLVITSPRDEDAGQYQCFATNKLGTATSNSVSVRKSELSNFEYRDPETVKVTEGDPSRLLCKPPDGYPKPSVYWMIQDDRGTLWSINSTRMTVDPQGILWFSNVTLKDESNDFTYACAVTSTFRNEYKIGSKVFLKVFPSDKGHGEPSDFARPAEEQYATPTDQVVIRGKELRLYCIFSGSPLPEIKWEKIDGSLPSERLEFSDYGKTLIVNYVDFEDAGQYRCTADNGIGEAKIHIVNVKVEAMPYFIKEPEIQNKADGETAAFECIATGQPQPEIKWIFNGMPLETEPVKENRRIEKNMVTITNLTKVDIGNYGCNATNVHGYAYKEVYVNVLALSPEIQEPPPTHLETVIDQEANLTCRVFGAPKPNITWFRGNQQVDGDRYYITDDGDLIIKDAGFADSGDYECRAENKFGKQKAKGYLLVKDKTKIIERPSDIEVAKDKTATFRCTADTDEDLELKIEWLFDGKKIDFDREPRFVQHPDSSLSITKTTDMDSGIYTCIASTKLDEVRESATLIVQDVPNAPKLQHVDCNERNAKVEWNPTGDNKAPILGYIIQYNTSFHPGDWENAFDDVPATSTTFSINLSPWTNYTFRVIARNKIGPSEPSEISDVCSTPVDVPYKNPEGVEGKGSAPDNLVINWSKMPEIEHNGPGFMYRIHWKRADIEDDWKTEDVPWDQESFLIESQPVFRPYRIRVEALNEKGKANVAAEEKEGWSGEDRPTEAPQNLTVVEVVDATTAVLTWLPVSNESIRGHFKGYKIRTWTKDDSEESAKELIIGNNNEPKAHITVFVPFTTNYAQVMVYNGVYNGPPSEEVVIETPEGIPGPVDSLEAFPMGSHAFYLVWKKPKQANGILTGYNVFYQEVIGTDTGRLQERMPPITDAMVTRAKLAGLQPDTKYRIIISARTSMGKGNQYFIERKTRKLGAVLPGKPSFIFQHVTTKDGPPAVKITFIPNIEFNPGSHFFVEYRLYGETEFQRTDDILRQDFTVLENLDHDQMYDIRVVAVDGDFVMPSDIEEVDTSTTGISSGVIRRPYENVATRGWFIGMMLAIAFLLLILIIVCIIKRNRGGKYAVHEREAAHGRTDFTEEAGFPEYSQPLDKKQDSLGSSKQPLDSDTDSMAEYGEGDTEGMAEDGSFIGLYSGRKTDVEANAFTALM